MATPGRLHDLIDRGDCRLDQVAITVLDEADQMADMGFLPQVTALLEQVAPNGQRMLFSATLDRDVDRLVRRFLTDPVVALGRPGHRRGHHDGAPRAARRRRRTSTPPLTQIAARDGRMIMFMDTKHRADRLARHLLASGVRAAALHGGKSQPQRTRILEQFRTGQVDRPGRHRRGGPRHPRRRPRPGRQRRPADRRTRTTCTAAVVPPGPASPAPSSPWSCPSSAATWPG